MTGMTATKLRLGLAAIALLALGAACSGGDDDVAGRLTVDGRAEVSSPGGKVQEERGSRSVKFGQGVKVVEGTAVIRLDRGRQLDLRTGTNVVLEDAADDGNRPVTQPQLLENDLLVQAPPGNRLTVSTDGTDVIVSSAARISRGPVLVVSSYAGDVELRSGDQSTVVTALREVTVDADGRIVSGPVPLSYDADDPWDRRLLSEAIEVGNELEARSKGFSAQLGATDGRTVEFLLGLLPALGAQPAFAPTLFDPLRPPGESLVGASIALAGSQGSFEQRWAGIFGFRDQGAQWGLVALDQGVTRAPLLSALDTAISRGPRSFEALPLPGDGDGELAAGGGSPSGGGGSSGSSGSSSGGSSGTGGSATPPVTAPVIPTLPPPGPPIPPVGPLDTGIPVLDDTINALVAALTGLLRGLGGA
ncbi:MAG: putative surface-exposed virulence protein [Actinomycetota bacterium]|nr:putative surface-exposed virulence protein [Actinomycetota bacterium]